MSDPSQTPNPNPAPTETPGTTTSSDQPSTNTPAGGQGGGQDSPGGGQQPTGPLTEEKKPEEAPQDPFDPAKLTLPEGMEKNEVFEEFTNFAKEAGFKHADSQKALDLAAKAIKANVEATYAAWHKQQNDWLTQIKADPELGPNLEASRQTFSRVADNLELTDPEFKNALNFTGAGTHPAIVRTLVRWAKALSEGGPVGGSPADRTRQGDQRSAADRIYPGGPHTGGPKLG